MESSNLPLAPPAETVRAATAGELIVLNGRQSGTRRALGVPTTFIGRAAGCDVRLNVEGVETFHCVLTYHAGEASIRDLNSSRGTFVNGQRIATTSLRDGDLLDVGPFRFRVLLPTARPTAATLVPEPDRDALQIQAAALAAQQAALDEQEARLLERRQAQIANGAAQEPQPDLQAEMDGARAALRVELHRERQDALAEIEAERDRARVELEAQRQRDREEVELASEHRAAEAERLARRSAALDRVRAELQYQQSELAIHQVRFNTQCELDTRLLQDGWRCLQEDQQRWRLRRNRETVALRARRLLLVEGERRLTEMRSAMLRDKQAWDVHQHALQVELHGLNNRVVHQRQLLQQQDELRRALAARPAPESPAGAPLEPALAKRSAELDRLASELTDQRAQLVEQWERLARVQHDWEARRDEAASALEAIGQRLAHQEETLGRREQDIEIAERRLRQQQDQLEHMRREAALALARAQAQQQAWQAEREQVLTETTCLSEQARRQLEALGALRQRWNQRRQRETDALRSERRACTELRLEVARARQDLQQIAYLFDIARRNLVAEAQALADGRPLRRRWLAQSAAVVRALRQQRETLAYELAEARALQQQLAENAERHLLEQAEMLERQTALDHREATLAANEARVEQETRQTEQQRWYTERKLILLQEETEQLVNALIADHEPQTALLERAA